ncbi:hypothetical protein ACFE04_027943 [Oxalis oulophora]
MHACNARCLLVKVSTHEGAKGNYLEKIPLPNAGEMPRTIETLKETQKEHEKVKIGAKTFIEGFVDTFTKGPSIFGKGEEPTKGNMIIMPPHNSDGGAAKVEESIKTRGERLLLASNDIEEAVNSKENDKLEDVVVMDYAQPHRKPPIHNEKP